MIEICAHVAVCLPITRISPSTSTTTTNATSGVSSGTSDDYDYYYYCCYYYPTTPPTRPGGGRGYNMERGEGAGILNHTVPSHYVFTFAPLCLHFCLASFFETRPLIRIISSGINRTKRAIRAVRKTRSTRATRSTEAPPVIPGSLRRFRRE